MVNEDRYRSLTEIERAQREDVGVQPFGSAEAEELRRMRADLHRMRVQLGALKGWCERNGHDYALSVVRRPGART